MPLSSSIAFSNTLTQPLTYSLTHPTTHPLTDSNLPFSRPFTSFLVVERKNAIAKRNAKRTETGHHLVKAVVVRLVGAEVGVGVVVEVGVEVGEVGVGGIVRC